MESTLHRREEFVFGELAGARLFASLQKLARPNVFQEGSIAMVSEVNPHAQLSALLRLRQGLELGEIDLADLLLGERMTHEAFRSEATARAAARRAITKIPIDRHE